MLARITEIDQYYTDLKQGTLPQYTVIEPRMATSATGPRCVASFTYTVYGVGACVAV